jgi:hypothetical protein
MNHDQPAKPEAAPEPARPRYSKPRLWTYGDVLTLTQTRDMTGSPDGGAPGMQKT